MQIANTANLLDLCLRAHGMYQAKRPYTPATPPLTQVAPSPWTPGSLL
jgi:hypothetical protein